MILRYVKPPRNNRRDVDTNVSPGPNQEIIFPAIGGIIVPHRCCAAIIVAKELTKIFEFTGRTVGTIACSEGAETVLQKPISNTKNKIHIALT